MKAFLTRLTSGILLLVIIGVTTVHLAAGRFGLR